MVDSSISLSVIMTSVKFISNNDYLSHVKMFRQIATVAGFKHRILVKGFCASNAIQKSQGVCWRKLMFWQGARDARFLWKPRKGLGKHGWFWIFFMGLIMFNVLVFVVWIRTLGVEVWCYFRYSSWHYYVDPRWNIGFKIKESLSKVTSFQVGRLYHPSLPRWIWIIDNPTGRKLFLASSTIFYFKWQMDFAVLFFASQLFFFLFVRWHPKSFLLQRFEAAIVPKNQRILELVDQKAKPRFPVKIP